MDMNTEQKARLYMAKTVNALSAIKFDGILDATELLRKCKRRGSTVWIIGNGGSASNASHLANDLTKMAGVKAISIPDLTSTTLAYGNDNGWNYMFLDTTMKLRREDDILIAISCSGNSPNIVKCAEFFNEFIVLTGNNRECKLAKLLPNTIIYAESDDITIQESVHSAVGHLLAVLLSDEL